MELIGHVIGGQEGPASDGDTFETIDPWTRRPWARVARGTRQDVDRAVAAARLAFDQGPWPRMGYERRGRLLHRLGELIEAHVDELARADTTDMGKPISVMREADVPRAAHNFRFFADHARMRPSEVFPMDSGHHAYVRYDPAGVVAAIAPWNFPLMLETWKIAPALAWGNTVVLKPAEDSPASATLLARLAMEAGFPEGVLNVVHGFGPDRPPGGGLAGGGPDHLHRRVRHRAGDRAGGRRQPGPGQPRAGRQGRQPGVRGRGPGRGRALVDPSD